MVIYVLLLAGSFAAPIGERGDVTAIFKTEAACVSAKEDFDNGVAEEPAKNLILFKSKCVPMELEAVPKAST